MSGSLNWWSVAALVLEVVAVILLAWDLRQTRSDVTRFNGRDRTEPSPSMPVHKTLRMPFDILGPEPANLAEHLRLRDERMDQIDRRIDNEIAEVMRYVDENVPKIVRREAEHRRAEDDHTGTVIDAITIGGLRLRAISLGLVFLALVFTTIGQLTSM